MIYRRALLVAALLVLSATTALGAGATMGRYDPAQTSYTSEKLPPPLALNWQYTGSKYDNNPAAPAVKDGVCYAACGDRVYAIDTDTGSLKWKYPSDLGLGGAVKGTPAIAGKYLYFGAADGNLYCLSAETGRFQWAYQTRGAVRCPPVVYEGVIFVGADDNSLYAIEAESGESAWSRTFTARDDIANGVAVGQGMVVVSCMDGNMYGVNSSSGKLRWIFRLPSAPVYTSPVISEGVVVMASANLMYGLTARSGQMRWVVKLPSDAAATPAVDGPDIYIPCRDKKIYSYAVTGRQVALKWTEPADLGTKISSSPTVANDLVYVTGSQGIIAAFAAKDGSLKWRYAVSPSQTNTPGSLYTDAASSPMVADGALYVLTDDGVVHQFKPDAPDNVSPQFFNQKPTSGVALHGAPPIKMSCILYDLGSGVDFSTVNMYLDGQPVDRDTDPMSSTVSFATEVGGPDKPVRPLPDGVHTVTVTAKDYMGNVLSTKWYFIADSSLPPPKRSTPAASTGKKTTAPPTKRVVPQPTPQPTPSAPGGTTAAPPPPPTMPGGADGPPAPIANPSAGSGTVAPPSP